MAPYAEGTSVPEDRSRSEIERVLKSYGATQFAYATKENLAVVMFRASERVIRITVPFPPVESFRMFPKRKGEYAARRRSDGAVEQVHAMEVRRRWRALLLAIKAKLEAVQSGITTFEAEWLAHIVLPNGQTFGEWAMPQLASGLMPTDIPMLPAHVGEEPGAPPRRRIVDVSSP